MAFCSVWHCLIFLAHWTILHAQSSSGPVECDRGHMSDCGPPFLSIDFSGGSGAHLLAEWSESLTPEKYSEVCSILQTFFPCSGAAVSRCTPPEGQSKIQLVSRAVASILSSCNDTQGFSNFKNTLKCGVKTVEFLGDCFRSAQGKIPQNEREIVLGNIYLLKDPQKNACCTVNLLKACIALRIQAECLTDEKDAANGFMEKILKGFECTDAVDQTCNA